MPSPGPISTGMGVPGPQLASDAVAVPGPTPTGVGVPDPLLATGRRRRTGPCYPQVQVSRTRSFATGPPRACKLA